MKIFHTIKYSFLVFFIILFGFIYILFDSSNFHKSYNDNHNSDFIISSIEYNEKIISTETQIETTINEVIKENKLININTADINELITLPSIGNITASLIIEYREKYGRFTQLEQIKNVNRIGEKTFQKIKDKIYID